MVSIHVRTCTLPTNLSMLIVLDTQINTLYLVSLGITVILKKHAACCAV